MKIILFIMWLFTGILVMVSGPTTLTYGLRWGMLMLCLVQDMIEEIYNK